MQNTRRRIIAVLFLFVTLNSLFAFFSEQVFCAGETAGAHVTIRASHECDPTQHHGSDSQENPTQHHSTNDHFCLGDCGCPCHAPLPTAVLSFSTSYSLTRLSYAEPVHFLPEVYLSLFDPPDVTA